jgi:hypothetical protein
MRPLLAPVFALLLIFSFVIAPEHAAAAPSRAQTHTVQRGDTLTELAITYGWSSWQPLYEANRDRIDNPHMLRIGTVLVVSPGASAPSRGPGNAAPVASSGNDIIAIITAAARRYGQSPSAMNAVARCESSLNPRAVNRSSGASGLFQFMPSTWRTTPYANQSIFDPVASANAAAWMWSVGRRGEWAC